MGYVSVLYAEEYTDYIITSCLTSYRAHCESVIEWPTLSLQRSCCRCCCCWCYCSRVHVRIINYVTSINSASATAPAWQAAIYVDQRKIA